MRALLDGDIYAFRSAASAEHETVGIAIHRLEEMIDGTLTQTGADSFDVFLSGDNNFRFKVYPEYKAGRNPVKPKHLAEVKQYLVDKYKAVTSDGCEADDLLGIAQCETLSKRNGDYTYLGGVPPETIICSLDKDLRMIPGWHYSFEIRGTSVKGLEWVRAAEKVQVDPLEGLRHFYTQVLTGDSTDNIKGAPGIGKVKAKALLENAGSEQEMFEIVSYQFGSEEHLLMTGQCLWIFRKPNDIWEFPKFAV